MDIEDNKGIGVIKPVNKHNNKVCEFCMIVIQVLELFYNSIGGDYMDASIDEIIKNIIHIDKSASELRSDVDLKISERKKNIGVEVEKLREDIVSKSLEKVEETRNQEIEKTRKEAEKIRKAASERCRYMEERYEELKGELAEDIFNEIMGI